MCGEKTDLQNKSMKILTEQLKISSWDSLTPRAVKKNQAKIWLKIPEKMEQTEHYHGSDKSCAFLIPTHSQSALSSEGQIRWSGARPLASGKNEIYAFSWEMNIFKYGRKIIQSSGAFLRIIANSTILSFWDPTKIVPFLTSRFYHHFFKKFAAKCG